MIINNSLHLNLINDELTFLTNEFDKLLRKQAAKMFVENQLFICRYQGFDEIRGNLIVKFDHRICIPPRRNENLQCFVSGIQNDNVKNWGILTYRDLRTKVTTQFECRTVFFTYEKDFTTVGLSGVKIEDVSKFQKDALVFLAPTDPPLNYLLNLSNFLKDRRLEKDEILDLEIGLNNWRPEPLIVDDNIIVKIQFDLIQYDYVLIQGPAGTGKTTLMAQICNALLKADFRILVTALTNRALVELAEKDYLKNALSEGKIFKSALTADESKNQKIKGIKAFKSLSQQKPPLLLTSYYVMSQIAAKAIEDTHFDYIIVEEASQAFLSTIALVRKLGKKLIIVGDIKQLEPIFHKEFAPEDTNNYHWMICGLKAISYNLLNSKQYILIDSYRLTPKSVKATNAFYNGALRSKSNAILPLHFEEYTYLKKSLDSYGGTTLKLFDLPEGKIPSKECTSYIVEIVKELNQYSKKSEIAILSYNRITVRYLQKEIYSRCENKDCLLVETIDRIQGLTTDFCIFFIPIESMPFALQANRFNVATSRARFCTLIIADRTIKYFKDSSPEISTFFNYVLKV